MNRSDARAAAMKLIYEWEMGGDGGDETVSGILEISPDDPGFAYSRRLFDGVTQNAAALDERIATFAVGWKLDRITRVDLAILRLAAFELQLGEVPPAVVVSEAVELSRIYSTDKAGAFINGVLGGMLRAPKS